MEEEQPVPVVTLTSIMSSRRHNREDEKETEIGAGQHQHQHQQQLTPREILQQATDALNAWDRILTETKDPADEIYYYAKQLWTEDKNMWSTARRKTLRNQWTVAEFDRNVNSLHQRQKPVWDILLAKQVTFCCKLQEAHGNLHRVRQSIKESLREDPLSQKYIHPFAHLFGKPLHADQQELRHAYHYQLRRQFLDADEDWERLAGYPSGILTQVQLLSSNAVREISHVIDNVHTRKTVVYS